MESILSSISSVLLLLAALWLWRCQWIARLKHSSASLAQFEELTRTVELTQRDCLSSIENLQGQVEELQNRARSVEQELGRFVDPPQLAPKEQLQAAALLLADGHAAERVAGVLALPVGQIELLEELQKIALQAHSLPDLQASVGVGKNPGRRAKKKPPNQETRKRTRPILLTDVIRVDGANQEKPRPLLKCAQGCVN